MKTKRKNALILVFFMLLCISKLTFGQESPKLIDTEIAL